MADRNNVQLYATKRLSIAREAELLQSFVRINVDDRDSSEEQADSPTKMTKPEMCDQQDKENKSRRGSAQKTEPKKSTTQLTQELKKKSKKRRKRSYGPKHEEVYCDKDRAAAVNLGSKDIKQSLKLKRKQDRSRTLHIPEEAEPGTFLALGNYELCRGEMQIALDFMSKALDMNPTEKNALVARSRCYILLGQPQNALKDAETALSIDKTFMKAIYQKAEALYYLGDFEHSLMYYHRGLHIRPDHEGFKLGVHKAQKAIENAIGSSFPGVTKTTNTPQDTTPSSSNTSAELSMTGSRAVRNTPKTSQRMTPLVKAKSAKKSRLLRELAPDKDYLDSLMNNPNIKCKYKEDDSGIVNCIKETVDYLNARQEFWRQQLPPNLK